jgi:hypothetical protein
MLILRAKSIFADEKKTVFGEELIVQNITF